MAAQQPSQPPLSQLGDKPGASVTYKLFKSLHMGMGDSDDTVTTRRMDDYYAPQQTTRKYNRVHGSMDARWPGQIRQGLKVKKVASGNHDLTPVFGVEWTDTNGIYPAIFYIVGTKVEKVEFSGVSEVSTNMNSNATNSATGGMFDDDGSGVPYLYACFGTAQNIVRMNRAQTFSIDSSGVKAGLLLSLNGDAYRTIVPTSGTASCQVSKCPYGSDRFDVTKWGEGQTVGFAGTSINVLTSVRGAPVALKPEGVFYYSQAYDRWVNATPSWWNFQHSLNGIGAYYLGDDLIIPMGDGGSAMFDGTTVTPFDIGGLMNTPNKHSTKDKFSVAAAMRHWIVGATKVGTKLNSFGDTELVYFYSGSVYTDLSANLRDLDLSTAGAFTLTTSGALYIGWIRPFTAFSVAFGTGQVNAATMTLAVGQSDGSYATLGAKNTGFRDFSELAGVPLGQTGNVVFMVDPVDGKAWTQTTVNGTTAYWLKVTTSANWSAISMVNLQLSAWYPSVDATNFPLDGLDKAGNLPHLLFGRDSGTTPIWHDIASLSEPDEIGVVIFSNVGGTSLNHARNLLAIGRFGVWLLQVGDNDRSGWEEQPFANTYGLIEGSSFIPMSDAADGEGRIVRLRQVSVIGHELDPGVKIHFYYSWEYGKKWSRGVRAMSLPDKMVFGDTIDNNVGVRFRWAIGFTGPSTSITSLAAITDIEAVFEVLADRPIDSVQERPVRTRPSF